MNENEKRIKELIDKLRDARERLDPPPAIEENQDPEQAEAEEERRENRRRYYRELAQELLDGLSPDRQRFDADTEANVATENADQGGLAVVVGHSAVGHGTYALSPPFPPGLGREEYHWNSDLALRIKALADRHSVRCKIFYRDGYTIPGAYVPVKAWKPTVAIELHFNSATPAARGTETWYGHESSIAWATRLQARMVPLYNRKGTNDRGIKDSRKIDPGTGERFRAFTSTTQLHPSALIEPFFDGNLDECTLAIERKNGLALAVLQAYGDFVGKVIGEPGNASHITPRPKPVPIPVQPGDSPPPAPVTITNPPLPVSALPESELFARLRSHYLMPETAIEFPELKIVTLAQWALESEWGSSDLAKLHMNFAGMKGLYEIGALKDIATVVDYTAHDGPDKYLRFATLANFVIGYWRFLERSPYRGWKDKYRQVTDPSKKEASFIKLIAATWAPVDGQYTSKVLSIADRLKAALSASIPGPAAPSAGTQHDAALSSATIPADAVSFRALYDLVIAKPIEFPALTATLLAQCAVESNWGRSLLAQAHYNFAGIEWSDAMAAHAVPTDYQSSSGVSGKYCRFLDYQAFITGYFGRLDRDARFAGWRAHSADAKAFLEFVGPKWRPSETSYVEKVSGVRARLTVATSAPHVGPPGTTSPGAIPDPVIPAGQIPDGYVILVRRTRVDKRGSARRTVGTYQVFYRGQKVPGLDGMTLEPLGPGDNGLSGRRNARRIEAKTYPLGTHVSPAGGKYATFGYTASTNPFARMRPAIRLDATGHRAGVLFHPAAGFLSSTGCLNLSAPLAGAGSNIDWDDSRRRVIALVNDMKQRLGASFPTSPWRTIPNAWMKIEEVFPGGVEATVENDRTASVLAPGMSSASRAQALRALVQTSSISGLEPDDIHEIAAASMNGSLGEGANVELLEALVEAGVDLTALRDENGMSLWTSWLDGIASAAETPPSVRAPFEEGLARIANLLKAKGVAIDDAAGLHTPLVRAAIGNDAPGVKALLDAGANPNARDSFGLTPLLAAAFFGSPDALAVLLLAADRSLAVGAPRAETDTGQDGVYAELPQEGQTAIEAAEFGRSLSVFEPEREDDYAKVLDLLTRQ